MSRTKIGMIGYDHIHAEFRSRALKEMAEEGEIVAIADSDEERGANAQQKFGGGLYRDYRGLLEQQDVELVFIHSGNNEHKAMVLDAVSAGKALFCEKPLATNAADALEMTCAVESAGLRNTVGFCSRYIPEAERAKQIIDGGLLGKIITVQAMIGLAWIREIGCPGYMADWMEDPIRGGGGALIDEGSHAFDLLHWFVGDLESVCSATARTAKPALRVEDNAMTLLRFEGGALGSLSTLWSLNIDIGMRSTLQLFGTNGTLFVDLTTKSPGLCLYSESAADKTLQGWTSPHIKPGDTEPHDYLSWPTHVQHYKREGTDVVKRFQSGEPFRTTFRDALKVARVIEAAYRSARANRFVSIEK